MKVKLIGIGCSVKQMTVEAAKAIQSADLIIGAPRMLADLPISGAKVVPSIRSGEILNILMKKQPAAACVLFSGDSGFYSGAQTLLPLLRENGIEAEVFPGISSLQSFAARLGTDWQHWRLCSAHGVECDPLAEIMYGQPCFFLTGGNSTPAGICSELTKAGLGKLKVWTGENLGYENESVSQGTAEEFAEREFASLSVLLTDAAPVMSKTAAGIPDEDFIRGKVPMTKREIRAVIPSLLRLSPSDTCWDIGAGTGSVSIEFALQCRGVWALERDPEALNLIRRNRAKFRAWNLRVIETAAPDGMDALPKPNAVFIGGSGGHLTEILRVVKNANPAARICVSAIALETLALASKTLAELGCSVNVTQISVSRAKPAGNLNLLMAQNPVFLITGEAA